MSTPVPDVVVLAGDIDSSGLRAVAWAEEVFHRIPVVYVAGNHEGYGRNLDNELEKIQIAARATKNVHFLNCDELFLDGVRFLGATLWTDFALFGEDMREAAMEKSEAVLNDYRRIRLATKGFRKLRTSDTAGFHDQHKTWLATRLANRHDGPTVVVTHMAPSLHSVSARYLDDLASSAYASNLEQLVSQSDLWIHGHMHESFDYPIENCRVVCNPFGYITKEGTAENPQFNPTFLIDL